MQYEDILTIRGEITKEDPMIFSHLEETLEEDEPEQEIVGIEIDIFLHDTYGSELHETRPASLTGQSCQFRGRR